MFANLEDTKLAHPVEEPKFVRVDPDVERVRRYWDETSPKDEHEGVNVCMKG